MRTIAELIDLSGRQTLLTGATGGLGIVMAETMAELGSDIVLLDRPGSDFDNLQLKLQKRWNVDVKCISCDLEFEDHRNEAMHYLQKEVERVDILVNNAAFAGENNLKGWVTPFEKQSVETWRRAVEVNLTAVFDLCKGCKPLMEKSSGATIINIGSIYGVNGPDYRLYEGTTMGNPAAYAASKGGLLQLTRWLATTLAPHIRVNGVSPGGVLRNQPDSFVQQYEARTPMGRMAVEEDFKGVIAFLASDMSSYVTGQNLVIDGGWTVW